MQLSSLRSNQCETSNALVMVLAASTTHLEEDQSAVSMQTIRAALEYVSETSVCAHPMKFIDTVRLHL